MRRIAGVFSWMIALVFALASPAAAQTRDSVVCRACRDSVVSQSSTADTIIDTALVKIPRTTYRSATRIVVSRVDSVIKVPVTLPPPPVDSGDTTKPNPGATVVFSSAWATGELTDGGKWTRATTSGAGNAIVPATGRGFPPGITNLYRVRHLNQAVDWAGITKPLPLPAIGQTLYFRVYLRNEIDIDVGTEYARTHPLESSAATAGGLGGQYYSMKYGSYSDGTFPWLFETSGTAWSPGTPSSTHGGRTYDPGTLKKNETYRIEWALTRRAANTYDLDIRIYDQAGKLAFDKNSIYIWADASRQTLAARGKNLTIGDDRVKTLRIGVNGGFLAPSPEYVYWSGVAVCTGTWCGGAN